MMTVRSTFSSRLIGGFALTVALTVLMGAASVAALTTVTRSKDDVIASAMRQLSESQQLSTIAEQRIGDYRAFLLTGSADNLAVFEQDRDQFLARAAQLRTLLHDSVTLRLLAKVSEAEVAYAAALDPTVQRRKAITTLENVSQLNATQVRPARLALQQAIAALITRVKADQDKASQASTRTATAAIVAVCILGGIAIASAVLIAIRLNRGLRREVGAAVAHIRSSSAQLEAAAAHQASGGRHQASAMNEITTTISELLATSRQIADNAQRVSQIAENTVDAANNGDATINQTRASIAAIRAQVDQIVQHMLALGEKSQQIAGVADVVSELAEQTNILALNATIEASSAGEWGRRFAVVAEEIRKLADRTAGSGKEIRAMIDDVRTAVNTTVMATEIGAKAVDTGVQQFDQATTSFRRIADLVSTANDASREIELSTAQQSTAVEQVNTAASDTARVTRETENNAVQTGQTAAHLASLSSDLQKLVGATVP
jgi:methyl-accepting chemotaxis protein